MPALLAARGTKARAMSALGTMAVGAWMNNTAPTSASSFNICMASTYRVTGASPMMSTGLPCDQLAGSTALSFCCVASLKSSSVTPTDAAASAAITPTPPPFVSTVMVSLVFVRKRVKVSAAKNNSCKEFTRNMPARAMAASYTMSDPAMAPVCDAAACCPFGERPALTMMTGLLRAAALAADMNLRGDSIDSAYSKMARVCASLAK